MGIMTLQEIKSTGLAPSFAAVASADVIETAGDDRVMLYVKNGGSSSINVTVSAVNTSVDVLGVGSLAVDDMVVAVAAGAEKIIGPFAAAYRDGDGTVSVAYSATTSVTAAALKLKRIP